MSAYKNQSEFGKLLKEYRTDADLSMNGLGRQAGIDPAHISRLERPGSKIRPGKRTVLAFTKALSLNENDSFRLLESAGYSKDELYQSEHPLCQKNNIRSLDDLERIFEMGGYITNPVSEIIRYILKNPSIPKIERDKMGKEIYSYAKFLYDKALAESQNKKI